MALARLPLAWLTGQLAYDAPSLANGAVNTVNVTVTGAQVGDFVVGVSVDASNVTGISRVGDVIAADVVKVTFVNFTQSTVDMANANIKVIVLRDRDAGMP